MKNLRDFLNINEAADNMKFEYDREAKYKPNCKFLWINTEENLYGFITEATVQEWAEDYEDDPLAEELLKTKVGDYVSVDGFNHYIRIAK